MVGKCRVAAKDLLGESANAISLGQPVMHMGRYASDLVQLQCTGIV